MNTMDDNLSIISLNNRRKRINRMKTIIVNIVILLMILPTIGCIILGLQVSKLQKKVDELEIVHSQYGLIDDESKKDNYVYAAELTTNKEEAISVIEKQDTEMLDTELLDAGMLDTEKQDVLKQGLEDQTANKQGKKVKRKDNDDINSLSKGIYSGKKVYLTFDDGPSIYTDDILDILAEYQVKATFFVIGKEDKSSTDVYKRIVEEGHTLGMHSYSHVYKKIYNSIEDFDKDFTKLWKLLYDTTGYKPSIFRFPGGSDNLVNKNGMEEFIRYLNEGYVTYFDWNVLNGDATGVEYTKDQLIDNVLEGVAIKGTSIVLMHDSQTKETTVASLPGLLDVLISEGAEILPIDEDAPPIQMIKAESLK